MSLIAPNFKAQILMPQLCSLEKQIAAESLWGGSEQWLQEERTQRNLILMSPNAFRGSAE